MIMEEYEVRAQITTIRASSRASVKISDNFYTVEYMEERVVPDEEGIDIEKEREALWDTVNTECDNQVLEIKKVFGIKN